MQEMIAALALFKTLVLNQRIGAMLRALEQPSHQKPSRQKMLNFCESRDL